MQTAFEAQNSCVYFLRRQPAPRSTALCSFFKWAVSPTFKRNLRPPACKSPTKVPPIVFVPIFIFLLFPHPKRELFIDYASSSHLFLFFCVMLFINCLLFMVLSLFFTLSHTDTKREEYIHCFTALHTVWTKQMRQTLLLRFWRYWEQSNQGQPGLDVLNHWQQDISSQKHCIKTQHHAGFEGDRMKYKKQNEREWCSSKKSAWCVCVWVNACEWSITDSYRPLILGCVRVPLSPLKLHISVFIAELLVFSKPSSKRNHPSHSPINDSLSYPRLEFNNQQQQKAWVCVCAVVLGSGTPSTRN